MLKILPKKFFCTTGFLILLLFLASHFFANSVAAKTVNVLEYFVSDGQTTPMSNGEHFTYVETDSNGFRYYKQAGRTDLFEQFYVSDGLIRHAEDTTWATGPGQDINAMLYFVDGSYGTHGNVAQSIPENYKAMGWAPTTMEVGEVYETEGTVVGIRGGRFVDNQHTGPVTFAMQLVHQGAMQLPTGVYSNDAIALKIISGPGQGETFYYDKEVGWIGFDMGNSAAGAFVNIPLTNVPLDANFINIANLVPNTFLPGGSTSNTYAIINLNPDYNLGLHSWTLVEGAGGLYYYDHLIDPNAPQLTGLISGNPYPNVTSVYTIDPISGVDHPNSWASHILPGQGATLVGFGTTPGQQILLPPSGYDIGGGYSAIIMYADENNITLKYTREDDIVSGYTLYLSNLNVNPEILALYQQADAAGRIQLPALAAFQLLGTALGEEILVAIRDTGAFMDPRWQNDWWQKLVEAGIVLPPELIDILFPFMPPPPFAPPFPELLAACSNKPFPEKGPFRPDPCDACGARYLDEVPPVFACTQTPEVSQGTHVYVGEGGDDTGEVQACVEGSVDGAYFFMRNWGGNVKIDISETKVPFAGYNKRPWHEGQKDMEAEYLSQYLVGSYNRYAALNNCDLTDPECIRRILMKEE